MNTAKAYSAAALLALAGLLGGCGDKPPPMVAAPDDPVYCYRNLAEVNCFKAPYHRDERRLAGFQGPDPDAYPKPRPAPEPTLAAPPPLGFYVRDPEPVPVSPTGGQPVYTSSGLPDLGGPAPTSVPRAQPVRPVTPAKPPAKP